MKRTVLLVAAPRARGSRFTALAGAWELAVLAGIAKQHGVLPMTLDCRHASNGADSALEVALSQSPDVTLVTSDPDGLRSAALLASRLRGDGGLILLSGLHPTVRPQETLERYPWIDAVVRGPARAFLRGLTEEMRATDGKLDASCLKGVYFRSRSGEIECSSAGGASTPNLQPSATALCKVASSYGEIPFETAAGCDGGCRYCPHFAYWEHKNLTSPDPGHLAECLARVAKGSPSAPVRFLDCDFPIDGAGLALCEWVTAAVGAFRWSLSTCAERFTKDVATEASALGCLHVTMGLESVRESTTTFSGRRWRLDEIGSAVDSARRVGIRTQVNFILGLPRQGEREILECQRAAVELSPDSVGLFPLTGYPGTQVFERADEYGVRFERTGGSEPMAVVAETDMLSSPALSSLRDGFTRKLQSAGIALADGY